MVESLAPDRDFRCRIAPMALIGDDEVECVDRELFLRRILINILIADVEDRIAAEEVDGHPLNGGDIHESVAGLWLFEVALRQQVRIKLILPLQVLALEALMVNLVDLVEFEA